MSGLLVAAGGGTRQEALGVAIAIGSALLYDVGYVFEKQALNGLPEVSLHPASVLHTARTSRRWVVGFVAMLAGMVLRVGALTLAPVSVVQPILAGGLIALAAVGSSLLGEKVSRLHLAALLMVLAAVVSTGISANGSTTLARSIPGAHFFALALVVGAIVAASGSVGLRGRGRTSSPRGWIRGLAGTSVAAGLLFGLGAVAEKAVSTHMVTDGLVAGFFGSLATPYPWIFLVSTLTGTLVFQVGLQAHPASLMAALTNVTSTVCALVGAASVFGEALLPGGWWSLPRLLGFTAVLVAVGLLALEQRPTEGVMPLSRTGRAERPATS